MTKMENKRTTCIIFFEMDKQGFGRTIIRTIQDYLTGRTFTNRTDGIKSTERRIRAGLPQELALSPVLYNIYTSDIGREEGHTKTCR